MGGVRAFGHQLAARDLSRLALWLRPDGLQARARRNAWSAMVADRQRRVERLAVEVAVSRATAGADLRAGA
jgi:hypothetical protein